MEEAGKESNGVDNENESVLMRIILPQRSSLRISEPSKGMEISSATTLLELIKFYNKGNNGSWQYLTIQCPF